MLSNRTAKIASLVCASLALLVVARAHATAIAVNGTWTVLDEFMNPGDFFTGSGNLAGPDSPSPWTFSSTGLVRFDITDLFVVSDQFKVFDFGVLVLTTPHDPPFDDPATASGAPPWTNNPDVAFADPAFSKGTIIFAAGAHEITIQDIHIPPGCDPSNPTAVCADGTVAFRASPVPEPTSLIFLGSGLVGLAAWRRRRSKRAA